jgi:hypothetical protein
MDIEHERARARAKMKRHRARRTKGVRCVMIRLTAGEIERLIGAGYLPAPAMDAYMPNPSIAAAVEAFIADHL